MSLCAGNSRKTPPSTPKPFSSSAGARFSSSGRCVGGGARRGTLLTYRAGGIQNTGIVIPPYCFGMFNLLDVALLSACAWAFGLHWYILYLVNELDREPRDHDAVDFVNVYEIAEQKLMFVRVLHVVCAVATDCLTCACRRCRAG